MDIERGEKSPVIILPENGGWVSLLEEKLEYYKIRRQEKHKFKHPELTNITSVGYKIRVLSALLDNGEILTFDLSRELAKEDDGRFVNGHFQNACAVVAEYCKNINFLTVHVQKDRDLYGSLGD